MSEVDRKTIKVLLAAPQIEQHELADRMGYDPAYVSNVFGGFGEARLAFRRAFGETIGSLVLGTFDPEAEESYPAAPLLELITARASEGPSRREFYRDLGASSQALKARRTFEGMFVDRICCALGVHPSTVYGDSVFDRSPFGSCDLDGEDQEREAS